LRKLRTGIQPRNQYKPKIGVGVIVFFVLQFCEPLLAQDAKKVRMAYSAFSVSFLNIFVARDAGLFKKQGLDIELIQMAGPLPVAALASGEIDYLTGYTTGIVATGQGAPLKGIMISLRKPPFFLIAEPNIQRASELTVKESALTESAACSISSLVCCSNQKEQIRKKPFSLRRVQCRTP